MRHTPRATCCICGETHVPSPHRYTCHRFNCQRVFAKERELLERELLYQRQVTAAHLELENKQPDGSSGNSKQWLPIVTPANTRKLTPLPRRRKYRFIKLLMRLIESDAAAKIAVNAAPAIEPISQLPIMGNTCANCRGSCCQRGGNSAYIDAVEVQRFKVSHPSADNRDIVAAYAKYIPTTTYAGSCLFHSETGCTLPREMRSDTCNQTICGGIGELRNRIELDQQAAFVLVAMKSTQVVRTRFAESSTVHP